MGEGGCEALFRCPFACRKTKILLHHEKWLSKWTTVESFTITEDLSLYGSQQPLDLCNGCCLVILLKGIVLTAAIYGLSRRRPPDSRLPPLLDRTPTLYRSATTYSWRRGITVIGLYSCWLWCPLKVFLEACSIVQLGLLGKSCKNWLGIGEGAPHSLMLYLCV